MSSVASARSYASMTSRDRESPSGRGGPIATSSTDAGSDPFPPSFSSSSSSQLPKPNKEDEWTTVSYKKPEPKNRSRNRHHHRYRNRRGGTPTQYKHEQIGRATTTAAAPGSGSSSSTVAVAAKDEAEDQLEPPRHASDAEIQGPLPGWYKTPLWDRRPGFARGGGREG